MILAVPLNIFLVKKYGLEGSAYANLIATFVYNITRYIYILTLFKLQPYTRKNLYVIGIAVVCFVPAWLIPFTANIYVDAVLRSAVFVLLYVFLLLRLNISEDITNLVNEKLGRVKK